MSVTKPTRTRAKQILLRVTPEEHRTLSEAARASGLGIGPWLRSLGLYFASQPRPNLHGPARAPPRGLAKYPP